MGTRDLSTVADVSIDDEVVKPFFAVEMLFDSGALRLWTGTYQLDLASVAWTGTGALLGISAIEETAEIAVRGATLTMSGLPEEIVALALQEPYQGRACSIYLGMFAEVYSPDLTELFSGYMDEMNIDEGDESSAIELKIENKLVDLERPRVMRYTTAYQESRHPGDKFFSHVEDIQDKVIPWGTSGNSQLDAAFYNTFFGGVL
ncbi:hypothetical protein [Roseovarius pacificus]|uniref:hypothetical protein n=1 Tax=Roseovarius pacificus TaxID=337701 RepID=UPI002A18D799|nr:hypothetical protein [Roseovarius pacificus]